MERTRRMDVQSNQPRPPRPKLDDWRGDIRRTPPAWRRRPRAEAFRELWEAARPLLAQIGEGKSWE